MVHIYFPQHNLHVYNYYVSWVWKKKMPAMMSSIQKAVENNSIVAGDFNYLGTDEFWPYLVPH